MARLNWFLALSLLCGICLAGCGGAKDVSPTKKIEGTTKEDKGEAKLPDPPKGKGR